LFLADKLAWDQPGLPPYDALVRAAMRDSLGRACLVHIEYCLENGLILMPHRQLLAALDWPYTVI